MQLQILNQDFWWENQKAVLASDLYFELWLSPDNFNRWLEMNIINNQYAEKHKDWILSHHHDVTKMVKDCILTLDYAKVLAMKAETAKWNEIRRYFINIEKEYIKLLKNKLELKSFINEVIEYNKTQLQKNVSIDELIDKWIYNNKNIIKWDFLKETPKNLYISFINYIFQTYNLHIWISKITFYKKLQSLWFQKITLNWYKFFKWITIKQCLTDK